MEHNVEINGVSICYEQQGGGRPVILLHGNGGSHHTFDGLIKGSRPPTPFMRRIAGAMGTAGRPDRSPMSSLPATRRS